MGIWFMPLPQISRSTLLSLEQAEDCLTYFFFIKMAFLKFLLFLFFLFSLSLMRAEELTVSVHIKALPSKELYF